MKLTELFIAVTKKLFKSKLKFAVTGGIASIYYRDDERLTTDIDFAIGACDKSDIETLTKIITSFGYSIGEVKQHHLTNQPMMNKNSQPPVILVGRNKVERTHSAGIDFLLPTLFWVKEAVDRAQKNLLAYESLLIPTVTIEDLIVSKLYAGRRKDLDDIEMILLANHNIDLPYLTEKISKSSLKVPKDIRKLIRSVKRDLP